MKKTVKEQKIKNKLQAETYAAKVGLPLREYITVGFNLCKTDKEKLYVTETGNAYIIKISGPTVVERNKIVLKWKVISETLGETDVRLYAGIERFLPEKLRKLYYRLRPQKMLVICTVK